MGRPQRYAQTAQNRQKAGKNRRNFASFSCVDSRKVLWVSKYFWRNFSIFLTFSPQKIQILVPLGYHRYLCLLLRSKQCAQNSQKQSKIRKSFAIFSCVHSREVLGTQNVFGKLLSI